MENVARPSTGQVINICVSKYASTAMTYESGTYVDGLATVACDVDKTA